MGDFVGVCSLMVSAVDIGWKDSDTKPDSLLPGGYVLMLVVSLFSSCIVDLYSCTFYRIMSHLLFAV